MTTAADADHRSVRAERHVNCVRPSKPGGMAQRMERSVSPCTERTPATARGPPALPRDLQHIGGLPNMPPIRSRSSSLQRSSRISTRNDVIAEVRRMFSPIESQFLLEMMRMALERPSVVAAIVAGAVALVIVLRVGFHLSRRKPPEPGTKPKLKPKKPRKRR